MEIYRCAFTKNYSSGRNPCQKPKGSLIFYRLCIFRKCLGTIRDIRPSISGLRALCYPSNLITYLFKDVSFGKIFVHVAATEFAAQA
ncbi:hypothetical protein CEXT_175731 [Caerostris extrusa]|uniref:Uncharacterized protein n=1 Tax=Caerostris extrusa TaxID=172846 RepID=A0AAV4MBP0_CAEEX|nr:hypothetical protein CEXT_175731 [Caerostris extrusa]